MRRLEYSQPRLLTKLSDELATVPSLAPTLDSFGRLIQAFKLSGGDSAHSIILHVPDDADEMAIRAVIAAHDPTPPPKRTQAEIRKAARDEILATIAQAGGDPQTKAMLRSVLTRLLDMIDATSPP